MAQSSLMAPRTFWRALLPGILFAGASTHYARAVLEPIWVYTVQATAVVQVNPPQIMLAWEPDKYGANGYVIYRKAKADTDWGAPIATLPGTATNFTDVNVTASAAYEYQFVKQATLGYIGYGYLYVGINAPLTENRGTFILVVETNATASLTNELAQFQSDLIGDGWQVIRHGVSSNDTPDAVKSLIVADYNADPTNVNAVFLFGHVPIFHSGNLDYDGHGPRPMPADAYYGDINGDWSSSPDFMPSDVELEVGRIDFFNMPGVGATIPFPSETELLRNYLNKDHNWRFKQINVRRVALMADRFGQDDHGEPKSATGYRTFAALIGIESPDQLQGNTVQAETSDTSDPTNRWISMLTQNSYVWTYACGGGFDTGISSMGLHGQYNDVWSTDIVNQNAQAVFFMLEGSHFGNWDVADNVMRSAVATPGMGLAVCCIAGHPHWFVHHMGLGDTIGYGTRLTMNNSTLYQT